MISKSFDPGQSDPVNGYFVQPFKERFERSPAHKQFPATMGSLRDSHGDHVDQLPEGFRPVAVSEGAPLAGIAPDSRANS